MNALFSGKIFSSPSMQYYYFENRHSFFFSQHHPVFTGLKGWVAPALMLLTTNYTPLKTGPITLEQLSWIGSVSSLGAMCGTFTSGCFINSMGCKRAMVGWTGGHLSISVLNGTFCFINVRNNQCTVYSVNISSQWLLST